MYEIVIEKEIRLRANDRKLSKSKTVDMLPRLPTVVLYSYTDAAYMNEREDC